MSFSSPLRSLHLGAFVALHDQHPSWKPHCHQHLSPLHIYLERHASCARIPSQSNSRCRRLSTGLPDEINEPVCTCQRQYSNNLQVRNTICRASICGMDLSSCSMFIRPNLLATFLNRIGRSPKGRTGHSLRSNSDAPNKPSFAIYSRHHR